MTIDDFIDSFDITALKEEHGIALFREKMFIADEWKDDKEYSVGDKVYLMQSSNMVFYSAIATNIGQNPSNSSEQWEEIKDMAALFYTTEEVEQQIALQKEWLKDLCYKRGFSVKRVGVRIKSLLGLAICGGMYNLKNGDVDGVVETSTSIAGTSKSGEMNEFVKAFPWFNNVFGMLAMPIYLSLFSYDLRMFRVVANNPYNYS